MSFTVKGQREMMRKVQRLAKRMPDKAAQALHVEAERVMTTSKRDHVPVDDGTLRASGFVNPPERSGKDISISMGYGGAAEAYAVSVHETPSKHDPPSWRGVDVQFHPAGRGPKYLERPMMDAIPGMAVRIATRMEPDVGDTK